MFHSQPTIHIQYDDLVVRRRQIRIAGDAHQTRVQMLPANVGIGQMVDGLAVGSLVEGLVDDRVVQVPGNIGSRTTCAREYLYCLGHWEEEEPLPPDTSQARTMSLPSLKDSTVLVLSCLFGSYIMGLSGGTITVRFIFRLRVGELRKSTRQR